MHSFSQYLITYKKEWCITVSRSLCVWSKKKKWGHGHKSFAGYALPLTGPGDVYKRQGEVWVMWSLTPRMQCRLSSEPRPQKRQTGHPVSLTPSPLWAWPQQSSGIAFRRRTQRCSRPVYRPHLSCDGKVWHVEKWEVKENIMKGMSYFTAEGAFCFKFIAFIWQLWYWCNSYF